MSSNGCNIEDTDKGTSDSEGRVAHREVVTATSGRRTHSQRAGDLLEDQLQRDAAGQM